MVTFTFLICFFPQCWGKTRAVCHTFTFTTNEQYCSTGEVCFFVPATTTVGYV